MPLLESSNLQLGKEMGSKVGELLAEVKADMQTELEKLGTQQLFDNHSEATARIISLAEASVGSTTTRRHNRQRARRNITRSYKREELLLVRRPETENYEKNVSAVDGIKSNIYNII